MTRTGWLLIGLGALAILFALRTRPPDTADMQSKGPSTRARIKRTVAGPASYGVTDQGI